MLTRTNYKGVFAYPPTPFTNEKLLLDEEAVRRNIQKLAGIGVDGIVMAGTTGEFYTLEEWEFRRLAEIFQEECANAGVLSVLVANALTTREVIKSSLMARELGLDGVMALQPFYYPLTQEESHQFWKELSTECPDIGLVIYNYGSANQNYSLDTFRHLAQLPNIVGSKEAHWDFGTWLKYHQCSPLVHMSATDAGWLVEMYKHNAVGVGSTHISLMPHIFSDVLESCSVGDFPSADRHLCPITNFIGRMKLGTGQPHVFPSELDGWNHYSSIARHKALVDAFGFLEAGPPRRPSIGIPEKLQQKLRDYIEKYWESLIPPDKIHKIRKGVRLWREPQTQNRFLSIAEKNPPYFHQKET